MVVGPAAGGMLAERGGGLFRRYPYALPNAFAAGLALVALVVIEAWLPGKSSYARVAEADTDEDKDEAPAPRRACATSWFPSCFHRHHPGLRPLRARAPTGSQRR